MTIIRRYISIRPNGRTKHNDPTHSKPYRSAGLPIWPEDYFDHTDLCLCRGYARIGWPATGDLSKIKAVPVRTAAYDVPSKNVRQLETFRTIGPSDGVILPRPGEDCYYIGDVVSGYEWCGDRLTDSYESAHRIGVKWDRTADGRFVKYRAGDLRLSRKGWPFTYALCELNNENAIGVINAARRRVAGQSR